MMTWETQKKLKQNIENTIRQENMTKLTKINKICSGSERLAMRNKNSNVMSRKNMVKKSPDKAIDPEYQRIRNKLNTYFQMKDGNKNTMDMMTHTNASDSKKNNFIETTRSDGKILKQELLNSPQKNDKNNLVIKRPSLLSYNNMIERSKFWLEKKKSKVSELKNHQKEKEIEGCTFSPHFWTNAKYRDALVHKAYGGQICCSGTTKEK